MIFLILVTFFRRDTRMDRPKRGPGFASMSPERMREVASKAGRIAHEKGKAHKWTSDEARAAGRKGGQASRGGRGKLTVQPDQNADIVKTETGTATP